MHRVISDPLFHSSAIQYQWDLSICLGLGGSGGKAVAACRSIHHGAQDHMDTCPPNQVHLWRQQSLFLIMSMNQAQEGGKDTAHNGPTDPPSWPQSATTLCYSKHLYRSCIQTMIIKLVSGHNSMCNTLPCFTM